MIPRSVRARFALGTAVLLLAALAAFSILIYQALAARLLASVDASLELVGAQVASGLEFQKGSPVFPEPFREEPENVDLRQRGFTAWVIGPAGETLASFGRFDSLAAPSAAGPAFTTESISGGADLIRLHRYPVGASGEAVVIVVATSLEELADTLDALRAILGLAVPILVALAAAGGYVLAARALAPIDRITRTARRISGEDLSARIRLPAREDEVGRLAATFDEMLERLEASFRRERRFTADASHELRTPLGAIRAILDTTRSRRREAAEYEQALADLDLEADRLQRLAEDLLRLARAEDGTAPPRQQVDLSTLLASLVRAFLPRAEAKGLLFTNEITPDLTVLGTSDDLERLFSNLIDNAIRFTEAGRVWISARGNGEIHVTVGDTGIGIPEPDLRRVFDRFYRAESSRTSPGAGLGLALASEIAGAHAGRIEVESRVGEGSRFEVWLPSQEAASARGVDPSG